MPASETPDPLPVEPAPAGPAGEHGDLPDVDAADRALLAAFDRLAPQGSLRWGFDDAMRRISEPEAGGTTGAAPWAGLPADLWDRGRSARIGQRFVGDVAGVLADVLAADARAAAAAAASGVNEATGDALRYLAARVEALEARSDPAGLVSAQLPVEPPDPGAWADQLEGWLGPVDTDAPVVVGESGQGDVLRSLRRSGRRVQGVEPRGASAWAALTDPADPSDVVLGEVLDHLVSLPEGSAAGVVLAGCVDRLDLAGKVALVGQAVRVCRAEGAIVVLATDQVWWEEQLTAVARDLVPGRPLHPETWSLLLRRYGADVESWHRSASGSRHAVVARVPR